MTTKLQRAGMRTAQPMWLRLFAIFCIGLVAVGSTAQVCHAHVDAFEASLLAQVHSSPVHAAGEISKDPATKPDSDSSSAVNCPLCVAMHSALPVADALPQVAVVALTTVAPAVDDAPRMFRWHFDMASRPPPVERFDA
jgi:hypothetical protein